MVPIADVGHHGAGEKLVGRRIQADHQECRHGPGQVTGGQHQQQERGQGSYDDGRLHGAMLVPVLRKAQPDG